MLGECCQYCSIYVLWRVPVKPRRSVSLARSATCPAHPQALSAWTPAMPASSTLRPCDEAGSDTPLPRTRPRTRPPETTRPACPACTCQGIGRVSAAMPLMLRTRR